MDSLLLAAASDLDDFTITIPDGLTIGTKVLIGIFLFAVALDVRIADFAAAVKRPWVFGVGLFTQFVVIPAASLAMIAALDATVGIASSVALGLILVVCLPAGNLSNLLTYRANGDVAMSVSMTTIASALSVLITPAALAVWGSASPQARDILEAVELTPADVAIDVGLLIGLPFAAGIAVAHRFPGFASRAKRYVEPAIVTLLTLLIIGGIAANASTALDYIALTGLAILGQNLLSLGLGYASASAMRLPATSRRAMTLEMGVRNTALGLVLALSFFGEFGGVAVTAALWGLWDLITGFALATWWKRRPVRDDAEPSAVPAP